MPLSIDRSSSGVEGPAAAAAAEAALAPADEARSESVGRGGRGREGGGVRGASPLVGTIFKVSPSATPAARRSSVEESCLPLKRIACCVGFSPLFPSICDWMSCTEEAVRSYFLPRRVTMTLTGA